ncbi:MAG: cytochrome C [Puniceicoccales bacterium]
MPFYEFYCPKNHTIYTFYARSLKHAGKVPRCPDDPKAPMQKQVSRFSFVRALNQEGDPALDDDKYDDPRYERAINELEREFQGMNEENPDPRQLGRLMKRMGEITGQKLPQSMMEMAARLEAGEDPEALEQEFGDDFDDDFDPMAMVDGGSGKKLLRRLKAGPKQDPVVYEFDDYVD